MLVSRQANQAMHPWQNEGASDEKNMNESVINKLIELFNTL